MLENVVLDIVDLMLESIKLVHERFLGIKTPEDFVSTSQGVTLLDAISMRLQVIGESVKRIQKVDPALLQEYPEIEWDKIARFRDLVSHHYEHVDHELGFDICKRHVPDLEMGIQRLCRRYAQGGGSESKP